MADEINWKILSKAVEYYQRIGYQYVELPWTAPEDLMRITTENVENATIINSDLGALVGSAEQSFITADYMGYLKGGKYVSCTPCFRNDLLDEWHQPMFMKVELYQNIFVDEKNLGEMIKDATILFNNLGVSPSTVTTDEGFDIEVAGIEVGSYGIREYKDKLLHWIYGTGLAEPRFSKARKMSWNDNGSTI